jgi:hypothetical protein
MSTLTNRNGRQYDLNDLELSTLTNRNGSQYDLNDLQPGRVEFLTNGTPLQVTGPGILQVPTSENEITTELRENMDEIHKDIEFVHENNKMKFILTGQTGTHLQYGVDPPGPSLAFCSMSLIRSRYNSACVVQEGGLTRICRRCQGATLTKKW